MPAVPCVAAIMDDKNFQEANTGIMPCVVALVIDKNVEEANQHPPHDTVPAVLCGPVVPCVAAIMSLIDKVSLKPMHASCQPCRVCQTS